VLIEVIISFGPRGRCPLSLLKSLDSSAPLG
jgi:hypothetical protein